MYRSKWWRLFFLCPSKFWDEQLVIRIASMLVNGGYETIRRVWVPIAPMCVNAIRYVPHKHLHRSSFHFILVLVLSHCFFLFSFSFLLSPLLLHIHLKESESEQPRERNKRKAKRHNHRNENRREKQTGSGAIEMTSWHLLARRLLLLDGRRDYSTRLSRLLSTRVLVSSE